MPHVHFAATASDLRRKMDDRARRLSNPTGGRQLNAISITIRAAASAAPTSRPANPPYGRQINAEPIVIRAGENSPQPVAVQTTYSYGRQIKEDPIIIPAGQSQASHRVPSLHSQDNRALTKAPTRSIANKPTTTVAGPPSTVSERRANCRELLQQLAISQKQGTNVAQAPNPPPARFVSHLIIAILHAAQRANMPYSGTMHQLPPWAFLSYTATPVPFRHTHSKANGRVPTHLKPLPTNQSPIPHLRPCRLITAAPSSGGPPTSLAW